MSVLHGIYGMPLALPPDQARACLLRMAQRSVRVADYNEPLQQCLITEDVAIGIDEGRRSAAAPRIATDGALLAAFQGRLDHRHELADRLGVQIHGRTSALGEARLPAPASLLLAAYRRYGLDCVEHLQGDWVFALRDRVHQRLVLARDATGNSALYWWHGGGQLYFATSLPALLAAGPVPSRLNRRHIAGLAVAFVDPAHPTATAFEDVRTLPPGHFLVAEDGQVDLRCWWHPERLAPLEDGPTAELHEQFVEIYRDAVLQRLHSDSGTVAATLSGGLDSGSVVALAAPALAERAQPLTAYVHTPRFPPDDPSALRTGNEWALAQATARHVGNVQLVACATPHVSVMEGFRQAHGVTAAPIPAASNWYWLQDLVAQARASGAGVLLTGAGGNTTVSLNGGGNLWHCVRTLKLMQVLSELRSEEAGPALALHRRLVKPALRPLWHHLKRAQAGWRVGADHGFLNPALARELDLESAMAGVAPDRYTHAVPAWRVAKWRLGLLPTGGGGPSAWAELGAAFAIDVRDPTRDRRLVEFCWRLPDEVFWSHGRQRGLIRTAMRSALPPEVRDCSRKGLQSSDLVARLRDCRDDVLSELALVSRHDLAREWLDIPRLVSAVESLLDASGPAHGGLQHVIQVVRAFGAAMFIERYS